MENKKQRGGARTGSGRPSILEDSKLIPVDMPRWMRTKLAEEATKRGIPRAELIRELIARGLENS